MSLNPSSLESLLRSRDSIFAPDLLLNAVADLNLFSLVLSEALTKDNISQRL